MSDQYCLYHGMTAGEALRTVEKVLERSGIDDPASDAWLIFEKASLLDRTGFIMNRGKVLSDDAVSDMEKYLEKRKEGMPVQYVLGEAWFFGYRFHVNRSVLIPRFDTEVLVEETLKTVRPGMKVLDLCTGSGCIIIALAKEADIKGFGSDISKEALDTAKQNNKDLRAGCAFIRSDLFSEIDDEFDIIVSNPPYIRTGDIDSLQKEIRNHEPHIALDGGRDGLSLYRKIAKSAPLHLRTGGSILLEIGFDQSDDVTRILAENGFCDIITVKDLAGHDRVVKAVLRR